MLSLIAAHTTINTHNFKTNTPPSNLVHDPNFTFVLMVFWELKPHFSYLLAQKNDLMFSTGTCLLQVLCSFLAVEAENPKPNGSGIWLDLMGREQGYSWLSISETEMICCAEPSGTPCFSSIFCTVMGNWLQLQCFGSQEHVCSGEMLWDRAGFLGWHKQADVPFEQQGNQLLS